MSARFAFGAIGALAGLAVLDSRRGSRSQRPWSAVADLSGYPDYAAVPKGLPVLRLPDGQVLTARSLLDTVDGERSSELAWLLFQYGDGKRAQQRLEKLARWLDELQAPLTLWRGLYLRVGDVVRLGGGAEGNQHWTPNRDIALAFAWGSDWGPRMPQRITPGMRPVLLRAVLADLSGVDWVTTAHWYLGVVEDPEQEVYLKPWAAVDLVQRAKVIEDP
jgi:hypothetical protein